MVHTNKSDTDEIQERNVDRQLTRLWDENYENNVDNLLSGTASEPCKDFTAVDIGNCKFFTVLFEFDWIFLILNPHSAIPQGVAHYLYHMPCPVMQKI